MYNGNSLGWSGGAYWKCRTQKPIALISQQQQQQQFELWTRQQKENLVCLWLYLFLFKLCAWKKSHALTRPRLSLFPLCKEIKKQQKTLLPLLLLLLLLWFSFNFVVTFPCFGFTYFSFLFVFITSRPCAMYLTNLFLLTAISLSLKELKVPT